MQPISNDTDDATTIDMDVCDKSSSSFLYMDEDEASTVQQVGSDEPGARGSSLDQSLSAGSSSRNNAELMASAEDISSTTLPSAEVLMRLLLPICEPVAQDGVETSFVDTEAEVTASIQAAPLTMHSTSDAALLSMPPPAAESCTAMVKYRPDKVIVRESGDQVGDDRKRARAGDSRPRLRRHRFRGNCQWQRLVVFVGLALLPLVILTPWWRYTNGVASQDDAARGLEDRSHPGVLPVPNVSTTAIYEDTASTPRGTKVSAAKAADNVLSVHCLSASGNSPAAQSMEVRV